LCLPKRFNTPSSSSWTSVWILNYDRVDVASMQNAQPSSRQEEGSGRRSRHFLVACVQGLFLFDEQGKVVWEAPLGGEEGEIAQGLLALEDGRPLDLLSRLSEIVGDGEVVVESPSLERSLRASGFGGAVAVAPSTAAGRRLRHRLASEVPVHLLSSVGRRLALEKLKRSYSEWDRLVVQAVAAVDEISKAISLLYSRLREWYSIHFPELEKVVQDERLYASLVASQDPKAQPVAVEGLSEARIARIRREAERSMGVDLSPEDLEVIREMARSILFLDEKRSRMMGYVASLMERNAPNLAAVADPIVGARLIARAGGIEKLALMPATSVQTLGAEKALFRHITKGAKPPKHGIIFQHPYVRNSPRKLRGKIASVLASKISLAARMDAITGQDRSEELKAALDLTVSNIRSQKR